jgi:DNA-3-methyladenine glycosylase I
MVSTQDEKDNTTVRYRQARKRQKKSTASSSSASAGTDDNDWFEQFTQNDKVYYNYMTEEWGNEKLYQTDNQLFEKLSLEGAQSGLSWRTILHKREAYRRLFHKFDIDKVASMTTADIDRMITQNSENPTELVVRHRGKLESVINNAKIIKSLKADGAISSFREYLWSFIDYKPILNSWKSFKDIPSKTDESEIMSKALKKRGFKFVGATTMYAFMQSCGFVIDHPVGTTWWIEAEARLKTRQGGYQRR